MAEEPVECKDTVISHEFWQNNTMFIAICLTLIGLFAMFFLKAGAEQIVGNVVSGMLGIATGRGLR
jgi:hypothetical protein